MVPKQTKIVPKRIKFVRKNNIVIPILSAISDGGAETDKRGAETEKLVPKTPKLEVPKKVPKWLATILTTLHKNKNYLGSYLGNDFRKLGITITR